MSDTRKRRETILSLIGKKRIYTQKDLAKALQEQGFDTTQATVSRDIKALKLIKAEGRYAPPLPEIKPEPGVERLKGKVLDLKKAGDNLLVLFTPTGEAGAVGVVLDEAKFPFIVGTVAGDDTVFVACDGAAKTKQALKTLNDLIKM